MIGNPPRNDGTVLALCGGIGGAKLALGLSRILGRSLTVIVNTGDDFEHLGLSISPDIDTVLYTLAGIANPVVGWGRADESWAFMEALGQLGGETWFRLGDRDLALHVERTRMLRAGASLSVVTAHFASRFGVAPSIVPMSDDRVRTIIDTADGPLPFQRYFVERRCEPAVRGVHFEGAQDARPSSGLEAALRLPDIRAIILCPSNPYLSVDPILAVPGLRSALEKADAPVVAVSPIIGGAAVKGPTAKIMAELDVPATSQAIANHYRGLIDGLVIDRADEAERAFLGIPVHVTGTLMTDDADRERLAGEVLHFADSLTNEAERSTGLAR